MQAEEECFSALEEALKIDCTRCSGLCCTALCCAKTDGFPANKDAGVPCAHLAADFRCDIHGELVRRVLRGCVAYDCIGAGQKVTQRCYPHTNWRENAAIAEEIFGVFHVVTALHQMQWYLLEARVRATDAQLKSELEACIFENERMTALPPTEILHLAIEPYRARVNAGLRLVCGVSPRAPQQDYMGKSLKRARLDGRNFAGALLIAANLSDCSARGAIFLGADLRGANLRGSDLRGALFLTQMQINSAQGNAQTKLPLRLSRPASWE